MTGELLGEIVGLLTSIKSVLEEQSKILKSVEELNKQTIGLLLSIEVHTK